MVFVFWGVFKIDCFCVDFGVFYITIIAEKPFLIRKYRYFYE